MTNFENRTRIIGTTVEELEKLLGEKLKPEYTRLIMVWVTENWRKPLGLPLSKRLGFVLDGSLHILGLGNGIFELRRVQLGGGLLRIALERVCIHLDGLIFLNYSDGSRKAP